MKTICQLNGKIILHQDGEALAAMQANAAQYPGATASVVTDAEFATLLAAQPLDAAEATKKVKAEAQRRILTRLPGATAENYRDKELNYLGRQAELDAIALGTYRDSSGVLQPARALTAAEITEVATFSAFWAWVKANRDASALVESDWQTAGWAATFDHANSSRWPV